jgi:hypothetical protein
MYYYTVYPIYSLAIPSERVDQLIKLIDQEMGEAK